MAVPSGDAGPAKGGGDPGPPFARRRSAAGATRGRLGWATGVASGKSGEWGSRIFYLPLPGAGGGTYRQGLHPEKAPLPLKPTFSDYQILPGVVAVVSGISSKPDRSGTGLKAVLVVAA